MTRSTFQPGERAALNSERAGFSDSRLAGDSDQDTVPRRDDLAISESLGDIDRDLTVLERLVKPVAYFHGSITGGVVTTVSSSGLSVGVLTAVLTLELETARDVYSVMIANQLDTTDSYRPAMRDAEAFAVSSFDLVGAPRDLSMVDSEFAVWVWAL